MPPKRVLDTATYELTDWEKRISPQEAPPYAILSHRWRAEITFEDFRGNENISLHSMRLEARYEPSRMKHISACRVAHEAGFPYLWADTVCIDKTSTEELSRSLRSMYTWYREAAICYAFLDDVEGGAGRDAFARVARKGEKMVEVLQGEGAESVKLSVWFTRGWTLQELLAPQVMAFYDQDWKHVGSRSHLASQIQHTTGIDRLFLQGDNRLDEASVATKMSWMAGRSTSLVEDIAYSLIGLFDLPMQPIYGEGIKAFTRLQELLLQDPSFDESLFAWQSGIPLKCFGKKAAWTVDEWGFLAPSPDCFASSRDITKPTSSSRLAGGFQLSSQGITARIPVSETKNRWGIEQTEIDFPLACKRDDKTIVLRLVRVDKRSTRYNRKHCSEPLVASLKAKVGNNQRRGQHPALTSQVTVEHKYYT